MKNILVLAAAFLFFGCDRAPRIDKEDTKDYTTQESKDAGSGSGTDISPQLEKANASDTRMEVDTINSAQEAQQEKK